MQDFFNPIVFEWMGTYKQQVFFGWIGFWTEDFFEWGHYGSFTSELHFSIFFTLIFILVLPRCRYVSYSDAPRLSAMLFKRGNYGNHQADQCDGAFALYWW